MISLPPPARPDAIGADDVSLMATTIYLEGEGEPDEGQLAIGWVIRNRMDRAQRTVRQTILGLDERVDGDGQPYEAFSAWNDDYVRQRTARLISPDPAVWERCWRAAASALWRLVPDPTQGATFYLNLTLTRQQRPLHDLPRWYDPSRVTLRIGAHTFLRG